MKSVQDWRGDSIPVRSFTDFRDLAVLIGGHDPAQHPLSWYGAEYHAWLQQQYLGTGIEGFLARKRIVFVDSITDLTRQAMAYAYVPLSFDPGEAYQFAWSHEVVLIDGVTTTVKVAHARSPRAGRRARLRTRSA